MMRLRALVVAALMISAASRGAADKAADAYAKGDYAAAFKLHLKKAQQGVAGSQARVGFMYLNGEGVRQDEIEAALWCRKAAEQGDADVRKAIDAAIQVPHSPEAAFAAARSALLSRDISKALRSTLGGA